MLTMHEAQGDPMDVKFRSDKLRRLETDGKFNAGFSAPVIRAYRMRIHFIRAAVDERAFYAMKSFRYEKLKGKRSHQRSIRLNEQWRLILEIERAEPKNIAVIVAIEDYH